MAFSKQFWILQLVTMMAVTYVEGQSQAPCFFIFGDSLSDAGNNNARATVAKFNYLPYGIDFPSGPSGRATNGRTAPDFLAQFLGLPLIPTFANTFGSDATKGVNYASSAAGILLETGRQLGDVISMDEQIANHGITIASISSRLGGTEATQEYLNKCLYYVNIGSNDYLENYFQNPTTGIIDLSQFADLLIDNYSRQLRALHDKGAKKFALVSLGFTGCPPAAGILRNISNGCQPAITAGSIFNQKQKAMVDQLNSDFSGDASFIVVNAATVFTQNPDFIGLRVRNVSCCQTLPNTGSCVPNLPPCGNRNDYVFWDGFHPTETSHGILAKSAYNDPNPAFTYPTNIAHLLSSSP